jgi:hypothetical protein
MITAAPPFRLRSGLVALRDAVRAELAPLGVSVRLGFRDRTEQTNQGERRAARVVITPCDDDGKGGDILQPSRPGPRDIVDGNSVRVGTVRALRSWKRLLLVSVWAVDSERPTDEEAQIEATDALFELVVRAVQHAATANAVWGKARWTKSPVELSFGRELSAELVLDTPIYEEPVEVTYPNGELTKELTA